MAGLVLIPSSLALGDPALPFSFQAQVDAVIDGRRVRLSDGREAVCRISCRQALTDMRRWPTCADGRHAPMADTQPIRTAAARLADLVLGRNIRVDLATPDLDRHGRLRVALSRDGRDIASWLASEGMVRVFPEPGADPDRIGTLYEAESAARQAAAGFWATPVFDVQDANAYVGGTDRSEIVTGVVRRVSRVGARWHLEFGADWRLDFTAGLKSRPVRVLAREGVDVAELRSRSLRLRGWVRIWNGPFLEISDRLQLEFEGT